MSIDKQTTDLIQKIGEVTGTDPLADLLAKRREEDAAKAKPGIEAAELLLSHIKGGHTSSMARALGALLIRLDPATVDLSCAELAHEWMMEHYWADRISRQSADFDYAFARLKELGAVSRDKSVSYGDADYNIWYVEDGDTKVIVSECVCSCADDNIHLWMKWPLHFRCRRCSIDGCKDTRSLAEYEANWQLGYGDGRDKGYCFDLSDFDYRAKDALGVYYNIKWALWYLDVVKDAVTNPDPRDIP